MTEKHLKNCTIHLVIREMQIKTTLRLFFLHKSVWQRSIEQMTAYAGKDMEKGNIPLLLLGVQTSIATK